MNWNEEGADLMSKPSLSDAGLEAKRILLVEDQALIAMDVQDMLEGAGAVVIGPFGRVGDATAAAEREAIDAALIDVDLNGEPSWPVADALSLRGVPFAFATGFRAGNVGPPRFSEAAVLTKPYREKELVAMVRRLLSKAGPV